MFKKLHVYITFAYAFEHMPNYVRLLIEMMSKKQKLEEFKTISLTRECSTILHRKLPKKEKDPMSFTIPYKIADTTFKKVL